MGGKSGLVSVYVCVREKDRVGLLGLLSRNGVGGEKDINIGGSRVCARGGK